MTTEPEPNGWELLRSIRDLKDSFDGVARGMVSQSQHSAATDRITKLEADRDEQRKAKAQQWFAIGLSFLGMVGTVVTGIILFSIRGA
ncbi:hypothetical protein QMG61_05195 [Cryobacterium sp. PH31-AA6]|uniref:hypothetical protein n=1 Tax=Cryobacterium sp. PH31-AA6 TaxID=3046205 RepID=UPI0024BA4C91|nr:hypothetical protein [Cryobacterium sp. PH31-AA6]MDJ0323158.1 hypothetical protein [Cryobacterium sp. PH31-AA6]